MDWIAKVCSRKCYFDRIIGVSENYFKTNSHMDKITYGQKPDKIDTIGQYHRYHFANGG